MRKELKTIYNLIILLSIISILLPVFSFAQKNSQMPQPPQTFDELLVFFKKVFLFFWNIGKNVWQSVAGMWLKVAAFIDRVWDKYLFSKIKSVWNKVSGIFGKEVEKRKEALPGEIEKEKQEMKIDSIGKGKSLWEKIKGIFQKE